MDTEINLGWWQLASRRPSGRSVASEPEAWTVGPHDNPGSLSWGQESVESMFPSRLFSKAAPSYSGLCLRYPLHLQCHFFTFTYLNCVLTEDTPRSHFLSCIFSRLLKAYYVQALEKSRVHKLWSPGLQSFQEDVRDSQTEKEVENHIPGCFSKLLVYKVGFRPC